MECAEDPTVKFEGQVQRTLRELKKNNRFTEKEYNDIYPSSSRHGRFYATAKRHKVPAEYNDIIQLPLKALILLTQASFWTKAQSLVLFLKQTLVM